ncbi:hypothetical protein [Nonlabens sp.]|uniref:hypothetical protein n=1 Tax=Nonlabens sp. TaxID=1888209 RepID=UPI003F69BDE6
MTKSLSGDFIFIAFILVLTHVVSNYTIEEETLPLAELFTFKKILSLLVGTIAGTIAMYFFKKSKFIKSIDKNK